MNDTWKFSINEDNSYSHYGTDGTIDMDETFNEKNEPFCHDYINGVWVIDECKNLIGCKSCKATLIQEKWLSVIETGFTDNLKTYDFDDTTLAIIGARLAHCNSTTNLRDKELTFYDKNKEAVVFIDKATIVQFFEDFITARNDIDQNRIVLKKSVTDATTIQELDSIDINAGW